MEGSPQSFSGLLFVLIIAGLALRRVSDTIASSVPRDLGKVFFIVSIIIIIIGLGYAKVGLEGTLASIDDSTVDFDKMWGYWQISVSLIYCGLFCVRTSLKILNG